MPTLRSNRIIACVAAIALSLAIAASAAHACPGCSEALPSGNSQGSDSVTMSDNPQASTVQPALAEGFAYSIYLMLAVPYGMMAAAGIGGYIYYRKHFRKPAPVVPQA